MFRHAAHTFWARLMMVALAIPILCAGVSAQDPAAMASDAYKKYCASCHDGGVVRVPSRAVLQQRTSTYILKVLNAGVMKEQATFLSPPERMAVASWLGRKTASTVDASQVAHMCSNTISQAAEFTAPSWTSWGLGLENRRFQATEAAGLKLDDVRRLKLKWAFGVPDVTSMRSQPVVLGGRVVFGSGTMLYSIDAASGCTHWVTELPSALRSGIATGSLAGQARAFFGDSSANVYAVDLASGKPLWQTRVDTHPAALVTGTPVYHEGKLYVGVSSYEEASALIPAYVCCTFRGSVLALDATTGKILWQTYTIDRVASEKPNNKQGGAAMGPSGVGVWSAPTLDIQKKLLYVATGDNYSDPATNLSDAVLALNLDNGKIAWSHQFREGDAFNEACLMPGTKNCPDAGGPDFDLGASPMLVPRAGGRRALILAQKSGTVYAIDPDAVGKPLWKAQLGTGGVLGGIEWGAAADSKRIYVAISDEAFLPTNPPGLDPSKGGGLYALSLDKGDRLWSAAPSPCDGRRPCSPAQTAAITAIPGIVFSGSLNGHIRAYSTKDGQVLWDYDTGQNFKTVNGVAAHGGSISVAGPVVVGGTLYVLSGYDTFGEAPGNVLLAFTVDGR